MDLSLNLKRWFARTTPFENRKPGRSSAELHSQVDGFVAGDGGYRLPVVGESHHQTDLENIAGGRTHESAEYHCVAVLTPELDDPYDPQAVSVSVNGRQVGYLSRDWAPRFKAAFASNGYKRVECNAMIVGGWDRGKADRGSFGIKLDVSWPLDFKPTAP